MKLLFIQIILLNILSFNCYSEVYKWTDANGISHYTTNKPSKNSKPTKLPEIMKAEVKIPDSMLLSCIDHGGIDCSAGEDVDRSVICQDGFKDSAARFLFNCKSVKLIISDISELDANGNFLVYLRNKKGVKANNLEVTFTTKDKKKIPLEGPENIDAYQAAEYILPGSYIIKDKKPTKSDIDFSCTNCP